MPLEKEKSIQNESIEIVKLRREYDLKEQFINIYAEWGFFRCKEFSTMIVSNLMNYKIYLNKSY